MWVLSVSWSGKCWPIYSILGGLAQVEPKIKIWELNPDDLLPFLTCSFHCTLKDNWTLDTGWEASEYNVRINNAAKQPRTIVIVAFPLEISSSQKMATPQKARVNIPSDIQVKSVGHVHLLNLWGIYTFLSTWIHQLRWKCTIYNFSLLWYNY